MAGCARKNHSGHAASRYAYTSPPPSYRVQRRQLRGWIKWKVVSRPRVESLKEFFQKAVDDPRSEGLMIKLSDSGEVVVDEGGNEDVVAETTTATAPSTPTKKGRGRSRRKPLPATCEPDKRTSAWLKLKRDYVHGVGDSFDLVSAGAWHGNGRKAKWWSPVLLAIWDKQKGSLVVVCTCMSGFTDAFYQVMAERYVIGSDTCSKVPFKDVECEFGGLVPSVHFRPSEVWELRGADITLSLRFDNHTRIRLGSTRVEYSVPEIHTHKRGQAPRGCYSARALG